MPRFPGRTLAHRFHGSRDQQGTTDLHEPGPPGPASQNSIDYIENRLLSGGGSQNNDQRDEPSRWGRFKDFVVPEDRPTPVDALNVIGDFMFQKPDNWGDVRQDRFTESGLPPGARILPPPQMLQRGMAPAWVAFMIADWMHNHPDPRVRQRVRHGNWDIEQQGAAAPSPFLHRVLTQDD